MNTRDWFRAIAKEARPLAPASTAIAVVLLVGTDAPHGAFQSLLRSIRMAAFFLGPSALGALSVGHEFSLGTLPMLLTFPVSRRRLLIMKLSVLAALLVLLIALEASLGVANQPGKFGGYLVLAPAALGLFVAPWLTLETRRAIAGAVFAVAIPGTLLIMGQAAGVKIYGYAPAADNVAETVVRIGVLLSCIAGAILGWRRFMRLEVVDDGSRDDRAEAPAVVSGGRPGVVALNGPIRNLFAKEFHLQRLTLGIAALYAVTYTISVATMGGDPLFRPIAGVLTVVYGCLVATVAGAVASAEERQLGTLDSQLLLPVGVRRQWAIKCTTALAFAIALGFGLPRVLVGILPPELPGAHRFQQDLVEPNLAILTLLCAAIGLYLSSISRTTLAAVMFAFPVYMLVVILLRETAFPIMHFGFALVHGTTARLPFFYGGQSDTALVLALAGLLAAFIGGLALPNHRHTDRSLLRIVAHAALFVITLTAGIAVLGALRIFWI